MTLPGGTAAGRLRCGVALAAVMLALGACNEPIEVTPSRLAPYHGEWTGPNVTLSINQGRLAYRKTGGILDFADIAGSFRGLSGNDIVHGSGRVRGRLHVQVPPHRIGNVWKMTVEGVEVQRR